MRTPVGHILIDYTNYRNERGIREIVPSLLYWGTTKFHQERQWLLHALDIEKDAARDFAMEDVHSWTPVAASLSDKGVES